MSSPRIAAALERARSDAASPSSAPPDGRRRTRRVAIGDPQAPFEKFLEILDVHGLLGDHGRLREEVQLVGMGDYFDWGVAADRTRATEGGLRLLAWLAAHPADQVLLLLGNHDLGRVCELHGFDEAAFVRAREEADRAYRGGDPDPDLEERFLQRFPQLPSAEILARDFSAFHPAQRDLVTLLLKHRRLRIAHAPAKDLLLCHAGVARDDLELAGVPPNLDAPGLAAALNGLLDERVARWTSGPLDLHPLHQPGNARERVARGIFYQRPAKPDTLEPQSDFIGPPRRRFDPRLLPPGLTQAIGHIRDAKCRALLAEWVAPEETRDGPLRHLRVRGEEVRYARGVAGPGSPDAATLLFLDGGMPHAEARAYELLDLDTRAPLTK